MSQVLKGRVVLVAGATRGAGRGIAIELGAAGATVYCTGRTTRTQRSELNRPETIEETAGAGAGKLAARASPCRSIIWTRLKCKRWWRVSSVSKVAWMSWSTMSGGRIL